MPTPNQVHVKREDVQVTEADLLEVPQGTITEEGIRKKHQCFYSVLSFLAKRTRRSGDTPLNGRCSNSRNFEITTMAMATKQYKIRHRKTANRKLLRPISDGRI